MKLTANGIRRAFDALSDALARQQQRAEIVVVGGAAIVLLFGARDATRDVDALFVRPDAAIIRRAAGEVAEQLGLPIDWLNDAAKGYLVGLTVGEVLYQSAALVARAPSTAQLLAMKLAAWRDAIDRADARLLLSHLPRDKLGVWQAVLPLVPTPQQGKAA